ncbi:MAG TPA: hypothetical protein VMU04_04890 [Candidatus Acidoferrum sp.]|nr:hypothetical protein [Candidatus Acidoferrum sp.]
MALQLDEAPTRSGTRTRGFPLFRRWLAHPWVPAVLALGAVLVMLPALNLGLVMDDLPQRMIALPPDRVPPRLHDLGFPLKSGSFSTVLRDFFFGFYRDSQAAALVRKYGMFPWWTPASATIGLWRPVTAFTHWLDYQLYPDRPVLMHAQNIAWFAAVVFVVAIIYRKLMAPGWAAGLAGLLFLLDYNTYFPVAFVANRGFILSLCLGLACLYQHHQWRAERRRSGVLWSALFLALSVFANEGGASTLAFILAYALILEPGPVRRRALTVLPALLVIILWRIIYTLTGSGVFHVGGYIDPSKEPLLFAREVLPRALVLLGGELTEVAPDLLLGVKPSLQPLAIGLYAVPLVAVLGIFAPWLRRDKTAAFWCAVMLLAAIPAATVVPLGKNLGFVAVGACGLIASFIAGVFNGSHSVQQEEPKDTKAPGMGNQPSSPPRTRCILAGGACAMLLLAHGPGALVGRLLVTVGMPLELRSLAQVQNIGNPLGVENQDVIVINSPSMFALVYVPFARAIAHQPLPRSLRTLLPGCTTFELERTDEKTLVARSKTPDIFSCGDAGPVHKLYALRFSNMFLGELEFEKGERLERGGLEVEILDLDAERLPSRVAFRFKASLDSPTFRWLQFNFQTRSNEPFAVPRVGQRVTVFGPVP